MSSLCFNPYTHTRRDYFVPYRTLSPQWFQSTRPRGARPLKEAKKQDAAKFQSTRPHGARLRVCKYVSKYVMFQSTRPHGARPNYLVGPLKHKTVSIHAPTRGATSRGTCRRRIFVVSIHAPTRGATNIRSTSSSAPTTFQSTRPHGARPDAYWIAAWLLEFQSTRPHGARHRRKTSTVSSVSFQSTRPHGARPASDGNGDAVAEVSIHAPTRGATCGTLMHPTTTLSFNPRAHTGRDMSRRTCPVMYGVSIHAPTRGATSSDQVLL